MLSHLDGEPRLIKAWLPQALARGQGLLARGSRWERHKVGFNGLDCDRSVVTQDKDYLYEPVEKFGEGLTTSRPWNQSALAGVEQLNGRVAMLGFAAALVGEVLTGKGIVGQLAAMLRWVLG
jgi:hypothetical protein